MAADVRIALLDAEAGMKARSDDPLDRVPESIWPLVPIWFANLGPPIAALAHLQFSFILEHTACATRSKIGMHIITFVLMGVVVWAGIVAHGQWVKHGSDDPEQLPGPIGTRRLMALFGMIGAFIFGLFILAQWFPNFVLGTCERT
jgi:hypothetical protein